MLNLLREVDALKTPPKIIRGNYAFNVIGAENWSHSAVDAEGTVVISDSVGAIRGVRNGCVIFSINRDGPSPATMNDSVVIGANGTIYAGSPSKYVYAFR